MVQAIIFDLDDTLYPEKQFVMSGFFKVSEYISGKYDFDHDFIFNLLKEDFENGLREKNFNVMLKKLNIQNEPIEKLIKCYRVHEPSISLYPDAKTLLNSLKGKFKLGIITDGYLITQKNKIKALEIEDFFDIIIINDLYQRISKRNKEPFIKVLKNLMVKPENTLYIGDNPQKDFIRAKEIGIITVRIKRNCGEYFEIIMDEDYEADYTVSDLLKIMKILKNG